MSKEIDPQEVFNCLQEFGIEGIDQWKFHHFLRDLEKLIKYEERQRKKAKAQPVNDNCESCVSCTSSQLDAVHSPLSEIASNDNVLYFVESEKNYEYASTEKCATFANKRSLSTDPVALYHSYQSIWKKLKLPGETNHDALRRSIREKLRNTYHSENYLRGMKKLK